MYKSFIAGLFCVVALAAPIAAQAQDQSVVLLSWDGVRFDVMSSLMFWQQADATPSVCPSRKQEAVMPTLCGDYWSCLPNLCAMQLLPSRVAPGKTLTRPQHAAMLSGLPGSITGVEANSGDSSLPPGVTLYERVRNALGASVSMAHIGSWVYTVRGILASARNTAIDSDYILSRGPRDGSTGTSTNERLLQVIEQFAGQRFLVFAHLKGADVVAHGAGDSSERYLEAIVQLDLRLGELLAYLQDNGLADSTTVYVTTDHGFHGRLHQGGYRSEVARTFLASNRNDLECYTQATVLDVVPTILDTMGINPTGFPDLLGASRHVTLDQPDCFPPLCGDGNVEPGEDCEPGVPIAEDCTNLGGIRGSLDCFADCTYDTSGCTDEHPEVSVRFRRIDQPDPELVVRSRTKDSAGFSLDPDAMITEFGVRTANGDQWMCRVDPGNDEWRGTVRTVRWRDRHHDCGLEAFDFNINESRPFQMKASAQSTAIPVPADGETITLNTRFAGQTYEATLPCIKDGESSIECGIE
jgi:hypothetical protein